MRSYSRALRPAERIAIAVQACCAAYLAEQSLKAENAVVVIPDQEFVEKFMASFVDYERADARLDEHNNKGRAAAARDRAVELIKEISEWRRICVERVASAQQEKNDESNNF
jgi:hypothetical protein